MNSISILDCTLRDGGYCNEWNFGKNNIIRIIGGLIDSGVDIIECGYLSDTCRSDPDVSIYKDISELRDVIPTNRRNSILVVMVNYGEYNINDLTEKLPNDIDGIRVAFHKRDMENALLYAEEIKRRGYLVFLQPMLTMSYSLDELLFLLRRCDQIKPYAFYIVDSFGVMKRKDLVRLFYNIEHDLNSDIAIGFHSHNNLQLAYSNAQILVDMRTKHDIIIDSSIYGMGRGAGNLNTELFVEYLNDTIGGKYSLKPLLTIIDEILDRFYHNNFWGYSLPNYLSAVNNAHPNYARYLSDKHTLTVEQMSDIFDKMDKDKRVCFDESYIEYLYQQYLSKENSHDINMDEFKSLIRDKRVLLIAPGKQSIIQKDKVCQFIEQNDVVSIGINSDYRCNNCDFIFLSNLRRYRELDEDKYKKCIVTSNISMDSAYLSIEYGSLTNDYDMVKDNAGLMAIKLLMKCGVKEVFLAGMDGYSHDASDNFGDEKMAFVVRNELFDAMNKGIAEALRDFSKNIKICFLTTSQFDNL